MSTTITRKQYNPEGSETSALGLPCETVTETFDGSISSDGVSIDDAFDIEEIDITDDHSTGVLALVSEIANVQLQERLVPTDFTTPIIKGQPFKNGDECDWDADEVTAEVEEVELTTPITVEGVPVKRLWKATGVSFTSIKSSAIMDGRSTMNGYSVEGASDVVYKVLPNNAAINALVGVSGTSEDVEVDVEGGEIVPSENVNELKYELFAAMAKKAMDSLCSLALVGVGENGGVMSWMVKAHEEYGIEYRKLASSYALYPQATRAMFDSNYNTNVWMSMDGACQFDSKLNISADIEVRMTVVITNNSNTNNWFGNHNANMQYSGLVLQMGTDKGFRGAFASGWCSNYMTSTLNTEYSFEQTQKYVKVNGVTKYTDNGTPSDKNVVALIGSVFNKTSGGLYGKMKNLIAYSEGVWHPFIPVTLNTYYDISTGETLTNLGTGTAQLVIE